MSGITAGKTSRLMTVRLDPVTRDQLDEVAIISDRSLAQLVRYAVVSYLETAAGEVVVCPAARDESEDSLRSRHMTVRLPESLAEQIDGLARTCSVTASDVLRDAVSSWLATVNRDNLGSPTVSESPSPTQVSVGVCPDGR